MTEIASTSVVPAVRHGGSVRRFVLAAVTVLVWAAAALLLASGLVPEIDGTETELSIRATYVVLGLLVAGVPVLAFFVPHRRLVKRAVSALLAVERVPPEVPPVDAWQGPQRMFQRLRWGAYSAVAVPLVCLAISAVVYGAVLDDEAGLLVSIVFCAPPLLGLAVTATTTHRQLASVEAGLARGQVVPVRVARRVDQKQLVNEAYQSWFEAQLPDGQVVLLRTPFHFTWAADARGVVEATDLVLVVGRGGHQGALLVPSRPEDAVWLIGPVPQVRAPRGILKAFASGG